MRSLHIFSILVPVALAAVTPKKSLQTFVWQPEVGTKYQMILTGVVDPTAGTISPSEAPIFDVDLFYTNKSTIDNLHEQGKKVICYFSAGSSEDWRPDYAQFKTDDKGPCLAGWAGERWLDVRSANVFEVMRSRIALASEKGCDGIDPDNMDGYGNGSKFGLTQKDSINYFRKLAKEAHSYGMAIGLKNAQDILPDVLDDVQFAVNESCAEYDGDCDAYTALTDAGKPVLHIEYAKYSIKNGQPIISTNGEVNQETSDQLKAKYCFKSNAGFSTTFSTTIKILSLDGWVLYCDDTWTTTKTVSDGVHKGQRDCPNGN